MMKAPLPKNEKARLEALRRYDILDTPPEAAFDDLSRLAGQICGVPIASINLIDANRRWSKSNVGLKSLEIPRDISFCSHAILDPGILIVSDALQDKRFATNPLVVSGPPNIRFYAGVPLITRDGYALGTLCVMDYEPRNLTPEQIDTLKILGRQVITQLELRRSLTDLAQAMAERDQAEESLRQSEAYYKAIFDNVPIAIFTKNKEGVYTSRNPNTLQYWFQDPLGHTDIELLEPEIGQALRANDVMVMETGEEHALEETVHTPKGTKVVLSRKLPVRDAEGNITGILGISVDITERKRTEEALQASEARNRMILETALDAVVVMNDSGIIVEWSPQAEIIFGWSRAETIGRTVSETIIPYQYRPAHHQGLQRFLKTNEGAVLGQRIEITALHRDGHEFPVELSISSFRQDETWMFNAFVRDITKRKQVEIELRRQQAYMRQVLDINPHFIFAKDRQGRFTLANLAFAQAYGTTVEALIGKTDADFNPHKEMVARYNRDDVWVIETGQELFNSEEEIINIKGEHLWRKTVKRPILDENGNIMQVLGVATDITDRKRAEEELKKYQDQLEELVEARTAELEARVRELDALQRLMSREGWQAFRTARKENIQGYQFDQTGLQPVLAEETDNGGSPMTTAQPAPGNGHSIVKSVTLQGEVIGRIGIYGDDDSNQPLTPEDQEFLDTVAEQVAEALERARLLEQAQKRAVELETVARVGTIASTTLETQKLLQTVVDLTKSSFSLYHAHIYLLDETGQDLVLAAGAGEVGRQMTAQGWRIPFNREHSLVALAARTQQSIIANNVRQNPDFLPNPLLPHTRSELAVPMMAGNKLLGVLDVQADVINRFMDEDAQIKTTLATQVAVALENARLFEEQLKFADEIEDQAHRLALLNEMGAALTATRDINDIMQVVSSKTNQIVPGDRITVTLVNATGDYLEYYAFQGEGTKLTELSVNGTTVGRVMQENRVAIFPDIREFETPDARTLAKQGFRSAIIAPLMISSRVMGTLSVVSKSLGAYGSRDERLIRQIASLLASTIESRRLFEQTQTALAETEVLYDASAELNAAVTLNEVLQAAAAPGIMAGATSVLLLTFELNEAGQPEWAKMRVEWRREGAPTASVGNRFYLPDFPFAQLWLSDPHNPILVGNIATDERLDPVTRTISMAGGTSALVLMPLILAGRWVGLITIGWPEVQTFSSNDQRLYRSLMTQAAVAVNNLLLFEETRQRTAQLEKLAQIEASLSRARDEAEILAAVLQAIGVSAMTRVALQYLEVDDTGRPVISQTVASWRDGAIWAEDPALQLNVELDKLPTTRLWINTPNTALFIADIHNDARVDEISRAFAMSLRLGAVAVIPLYSAGSWQGALIFTWPEPHEFTSEERFILAELLEPITAVVVSRRAYLAQQKVLAQTEALYLASRRINEASNLQEVVAAVAEMKVIPIINRVVLFNFERDINNNIEAMQIVANWHSGQGSPPSPIGRRYTQAEFSTVKLMISPEPLFFEDTQTDPRMDAPIKAVAEQQNIRAMVVLPLRTGGRQLGVLLLQAEEAHKFSEQDIQAYFSLAPQVAAAIDNQRLLDETRTALAEVEAIQRRYTVQAWDTYRDRHPVHGYEQVKDQLLALEDEALPIDISPALEHKQAVVITTPARLTAGGSESTDEHPLLVSPAASSLVVPLTIRDQVIGVVGLQDTEVTARHWTPEEVALVEMIAEQLALAAENIRLLDETQQRAAREKRVNEIGEKIQAAQSLEEALRIAVKEVGLSLQAPQTLVQLAIE